MTSINVPQPPGKKTSTIRTDMAGKITAIIGSGNHAKDSIVWYTIKWSFLIGSIASLILAASFWSSCNGTAGFPIDNFKSIWGVFLPIVTLALGYTFGKGK